MTDLNGYTLTKLAQMFDQNRETMRRRLEMVKPLSEGGRGRGGGNKYSLKQVLDAYLAYESQQSSPDEIDPTQARARKDDEMAKRYEMENRVRSGELLQMEDVERTWSEVLAAVRAGVLNLPTKTAQLVSAEPDPAKCEQILRDACEESLEELSNGIS
jgi:phage terminase Nu1 subunit (DNA packaging protein)